MLGYLLARAGIDVVVLEKHADFLRDFRGDTIHPSTLELMHELGLLEAFLRLPHQQLDRVRVIFGDTVLPGPDFRRLPTQCKFIAMMPQWDFLNFLVSRAEQYPCFHLLMEAEVTDLQKEGGRITGVRAATAAGNINIDADLVVGADGRDSRVRECAGLEVRNLGVPIDVLWFRIDKGEANVQPVLAHFRSGRLMVTIDRGDYWQCGYIIGKGGFDTIRKQGLQSFRKAVVAVVPHLQSGIGALDDWDKVKLLTVQINRTQHWYRDGLLCIGDAAHAMSPAGGVGINLAIQDAVAAANLLYSGLHERSVTTADLRKVQRRRQWPVRMTQAIQAFLHKRMLRPGINVNKVPWPAQLFLGWPLLRMIPAMIIGIGFRPEHIHSPETGFAVNR